MARVAPGQYFVTADDWAVTATLGSCVAACIRNPETGAGGLTHFMQPKPSADTTSGRALYGRAALEALVTMLRDLAGAQTPLEAKVYGGGNLVDTTGQPAGARNVEFLRSYLRAAGIPIEGEDLGGTHPRKVVYYPATGRVLVRRMRRLQRRIVADQEQDYRATGLAAR